MLKCDKQVLKKILIEELNRDEEIANNIVANIESYNEKLQKTITTWMINRTILDDIEIEGVTLNYIMKKQDISFIDALSKMNWFIDEPEEAKIFAAIPEKYFYYFD